MSQPNGGVPQSGPTGAQSGAGGTDPANPAPPTPPVTDPPQSGTDPATGDAPVTKADYDALAARMAAADRRAAAAEKKIKDAEDLQLSEADKIKKQNEALQAELDKERERNQKQALENAVLLDKTYDWEDAGIVLQLIDRDLITFDDKGKPQGVKAALDKLVKDRKFLLKANDSGGGGGDGKGGTTGVPSGGRGTTGAPNDAERWERKFPAMRGRTPKG